jgi:hypothetical protein
MAFRRIYFAPAGLRVSGMTGIARFLTGLYVHGSETQLSIFLVSLEKLTPTHVTGLPHSQALR